jgi:2-octaprenyl-6-methoxyphenol hydroxylase
MYEKEFDVIIVGSGIIGASLALILAKTDFNVAIIEAAPLAKDLAHQPDKTIVLAHSSQIIFKMMGIWEQVAPNACAIQEIHVSDQGHFGGAQIKAEQEQIPALGYVVSAKAISLTLQQAINHPRITLFQPARFISYKYEDNHTLVTLTQDNISKTLKAKLLVGCDGQSSAVRTFLKIPATHYDYEQVALISHVQLKRPHQNIAYERFTQQGPLAFLPLRNQESAVIWTVSQQRASQLINLSSLEFKNALQKNFGYRLGKFLSCSKPVMINLQLVTCTKQIAPGAVLLGNAAHTLHPVAGQGLNLGLRDLAILAEEITAARRNKQALGDLNLLENYLARRQVDQEKIINFTHSLIGIFSNSLLPMVLARNIGLVLLDRVSSLKKLLTRRALGFSGKVPRLACGLSLE